MFIQDIDKNYVEKVIQNNYDLIKSKKGILSSGAKALYKAPMFLLCSPFIFLLKSIEQGLENGFFNGLIFGLLSLIIGIPVTAVLCGLSFAMGAAFLPLAILIDGVGSLISKKYRNELKLVKSVKKLSNIYLHNTQTLKSDEDIKQKFNGFERLNLGHFDINNLVKEIERLNTLVGREDRNVVLTDTVSSLNPKEKASLNDEKTIKNEKIIKKVKKIKEEHEDEDIDSKTL